MEYVKIVPESDILYVCLRDGKVARTLHRKPEIMIDVDENGEPLGIEVVGYSATPLDRFMKVLQEFGISLEFKYLTAA